MQLTMTELDDFKRYYCKHYTLSEYVEMVKRQREQAANRSADYVPKSWFNDEPKSLCDKVWNRRSNR